MKYDINKKYPPKKKLSQKKIFPKVIILFIILFVTVAGISIKNSDISSNDNGFFKLKQIIIKGVDKEKCNEIATKFDLNNLSIINFFKKKLKENLKDLYYISNVKISYKFLNIIEIEVFEKSIKYLLYNQFEGKFYQVSKDGTILGLEKSSNLLNYPIVTLKENVEYQKGDKYNSYKVIEDINFDFGNRISEIILDDNNTYGFFIDMPYYAYFGSNIDENKIKNIVLTNNVLEKEKSISYIDISYPSIGRIVYNKGN